MLPATMNSPRMPLCLLFLAALLASACSSGGGGGKAESTRAAGKSPPAVQATDPIKLGGYPESVRLPAPEFSQHTEEVLLEHGYSWEDITQLKEQGVIF